jgi:cytochrome c
MRPLLIALLLLGGCRNQVVENAERMTGGDVERGQQLIAAYGCGTCHEVPGVHAATGLVGPPLTNIGDRMYLAGQLPNTPQNMMRWMRDPQTIERDTAMPDMNVSEGDARDIAAYLYTLRR